MQLLRSPQFAGFLTKHFRRTEAVVIALTIGPMRLGVVVGHKALMRQPGSLPTGDLLEMHLANAPHHAEVSFDQILPALTRMDIFLLDVEGLADGEQLLGAKNVGPKTIRALALLSEIVYGAKPSFQDPARFTFAHGGKDGHPYPVDRKTYDQSIQILHNAVERAKVGDKEKLDAIKRLQKEVEKN